MFSSDAPLGQAGGTPAFLSGIYGAARTDSAFHIPGTSMAHFPPVPTSSSDRLSERCSQAPVTTPPYTSSLSAALSAASLPRPTPTFPMLDTSLLQGHLQPARYSFAAPYLSLGPSGFPPISLPEMKAVLHTPPLHTFPSTAEAPSLAQLTPKRMPANLVQAEHLSPSSSGMGENSNLQSSRSTPSPSANPHPFAAFLTARECPWFAFPYHQDIFR